MSEPRQQIWLTWGLGAIGIISGLIAVGMNERPKVAFGLIWLDAKFILLPVVILRLIRYS